MIWYLGCYLQTWRGTCTGESGKKKNSMRFARLQSLVIIFAGPFLLWHSIRKPQWKYWFCKVYSMIKLHRRLNLIASQSLHKQIVFLSTIQNSLERGLTWEHHKGADRPKGFNQKLREVRQCTGQQTTEPGTCHGNYVIMSRVCLMQRLDVGKLLWSGLQVS